MAIKIIYVIIPDNFQQDMEVVASLFMQKTTDDSIAKRFQKLSHDHDFIFVYPSFYNQDKMKLWVKYLGINEITNYTFMPSVGDDIYSLKEPQDQIINLANIVDLHAMFKNDNGVNEAIDIEEINNVVKGKVYSEEIGHDDDIDEVINALTIKIREHLEVCDAEHTPTICSMTATDSGKTLIITHVIGLIISDGYTIGSAINMIEHLYSDNKTEI